MDKRKNPMKKLAALDVRGNDGLPHFPMQLEGQEIQTGWKYLVLIAAMLIAACVSTRPAGPAATVSNCSHDFVTGSYVTRRNCLTPAQNKEQQRKLDQLGERLRTKPNEYPAPLP